MLDILIAARKAIGFVEGMSWEEFVQSELHQNAVIRPLEIIGEAARRISSETQQANPEIPWQQIVGMRNRLIHEYFRIDLEAVWETVRNDLPGLIAQVEPMIPPEEGS